MDKMIEFSRHMMMLVAEFLASEPIFYLYGMVIFMFVVKVFLTIIRQK